MFRALLVAVALAGFGTLAAACDGGGDELSLEEYFERVDELDQEQQDRSQEIEDELDALGEDASTDQVADAFEEQVGVLQDFIDDFEDVDPPDEARQTHDETVRALNAAVGQFETVIADFRDAATVEEGFAALENADFSEIEKADQACLDLEAIAADNNIEVDLDCEDE